MRVANQVWLGWLAVAVAAGCGSGDGTTDPDDELDVGTIVGRIDGQDWITTTAFAIYPGGRLVATGTGSNNLTFGFGVTAQAPGTYTAGGTANAYASLADGTTALWESAGPGGSGTLTITSFSANEVTGTFSFTIVRTHGSSAPTTRSVTNGRFRVRF